ncbi:tyrosine protein phosphatase 1 [Exserohilum turcicum]
MYVKTPLPHYALSPSDHDSTLFKLHKLRALRRKAKLKGGLIRTDPAMASPDDPISPSSSKRSRSKDSLRSLTTSSLNTPAANTPTASTNSLLNPLSVPGTPATQDNAAPHAIPYPAFLASTRHVGAKWLRLETALAERFRDAAQPTDADEPSRWARCCGEDYALRNRYGNVDPYQAHRVRLVVPEGHFDYINASPIVLETTSSHTPLKYIATQGPKAESWSHIWRMIWHENTSPAVVVMLTQTVEGYREKCHPYYPQSLDEPDLRVNEHDEFQDGLIHNLHLASCTIDEEARTQVREIDMTTDDGSESKKIWHLLFAGWADFSVPEGDDRAAMLKLIEMSRARNSDNTANPRIVHCSAGIGRSGTFIALDWLMQELYEGSLDNVAETEDPVVKVVEMLRDQRPGMVQSKVQFQFIYDVLRHQWRDRWLTQHPDEASQLGLGSAADTPDSEPALKRQKSVHNEEGYLSPPTASSPLSSGGACDSPEARAQLEAELQDADLEYENGKT